MSYTIKVVFGKEQVWKSYQQIPFTDEELKQHYKEYQFNSKAELDAFMYGVNESIGWTECCFPEYELHESWEAHNLSSNS